MFDLGWAELMFLAVLALIVVGPQDLPKLARAVGKLWGRLQRFYRDSLLQLHQLETEMDLASKPDQRNQPSYYDLLPEHVRQAMEHAEPSRNAEQNQRVHAMYEQAMAEVKAAHQPQGDETAKNATIPSTPSTSSNI
jgi:sec-independent protein translocase protein TatB